jgi:uncharacterized protein
VVVETLKPSNGKRVFIAQITPVEIISGISRLKRELIISANEATEARRLVRRHIMREYRVVNFTNRIVEHAQDLLETYSLRAYDAVQLASALEVQTKLAAANQPPLIFVSADVRLITVANSEALQTHNPV